MSSTDVVKLYARRKCAVLGSKRAKRALLEYGKCTVRYGKYNIVFPYRTFFKNSVRSLIPYRAFFQNLTAPNRNFVPNRTVVTLCLKLTLSS